MWSFDGFTTTQLFNWLTSKKKEMKNKDFDSFNNDRIANARKRINDLLLLIRNWEKQKQ
jgi:hypothetical protein